jgi:preprotein translocase subunit SecD
VLEFRKKDSEGNWVPATGTVTVDGETETRVLSSRYFKTNTSVTFDQTTNAPYLNFEWDAEGAQLSEQITTELKGKQLGIYLGDEPLLGDDGQPIAPVVNAVITDKGVIEGLSYKEASKLSDILNAGRIDVPLIPEYEKPVSASLGETFTRDAFRAAWVGLLIVALFMILYYRLPGVVSALALVIYAIIVLAIYKGIPVTLTLAGIAGFIVSLGMAVDANVLIFERMKEELRAGRTLKAAIEAGFNRAWPAIRDSNFTTFIACGILYWFGSSIVASSAVKGFSATLFIGVAVSMFSAIVVTKTLLLVLPGTWANKRLTWFGVEAKADAEAKGA